MEKVSDVMNGVGKITTSLKLMTGLLISLVLFIVIVVLLRYKLTNKYISVTGNIKDPQCETEQQEVCKTTKRGKQCSTKKVYNCEYDLVLKANGEEVVIKRTSEEKNHLNDDQPYFVEYNPANPQDVRKPFPYNLFLVILFVVFIIVLGGTGMTYVLSRSRLYRQMNAGLTGYSFIRNQFNND